MKFKTRKDSETGKKLTAVIKKIKEADKASKSLACELGAKQWRHALFVVAGGISALIFPDGTEIPKHFKKVAPGEYMPKRSVKAGKEVDARIEALPTVQPIELNACVNWDEPFSSIGYNGQNPDFYVLSVREKWMIDWPADCVEITTSEANTLTSINLQES